MQIINFSGTEAWQKQSAKHHLFSNICQVHYHRIAQIVEKTAKQSGLFYNLKPVFFTALASHVARLKETGTTKVPINQYANRSN